MKREVKRITMLLFIIGMFCTLSFGTVSATTKISESKVRKAYVPYMTKHRSQDFNGRNAYMLMDLNGDGVKELLIEHTAGVRARLLIYTYYKAKVRLLLDEYTVNGVHYQKKKHKICVSSSCGAAYGFENVYQLKAGKLKKVAAYKNVPSSKDWTKQVYYKNGKRISHAKYRKVLQTIYRWKDISPLSYGRRY